MARTTVVPLIWLACFLSSFLAAAHGLGPIGYLLVLGSPEAWGATQSFAALGLLALVLGMFVFKPAPTRDFYLLLALLLIYLAWLAAAIAAGSFFGQMLFSLHFQVATVVWLVMLVKSVEWRDALSLHILIWPLCVVSAVQLIDSLSWDVLGMPLAGLFVDPEQSFTLMSGINFTSQLLWILFFISIYLDWVRMRTPDA